MGASSSKPPSRIVDGQTFSEFRYQAPTQNSNSGYAINRSNYAVDEEYTFPSNRSGLSSSTMGSMNSYNNNAYRHSSFNAPSSSTATIRQSTVPTIDQLEDAEIARAIQLSLNDRTNRATPLSPPLLSSSSQYPRTNTAHVNRAKISGNTTSTSASEPKGEMAFDCSICMEFNDKDVIVATECGHVFHKDCVSPWIQQAGTCPSCRVRITITSLRKIFISVNSNNNASTSKTQNVGGNSKNAPVMIKNSNNNNNARNRIRRNNPNRSATSATSPTMFGRTIWLSSQDKQMTEQSLATYILQRFNIPSHKVLIKSLKKAGAVQPPQQYVSFKLDVDTENTFKTLVDMTKWPRTFRVREFIARN